MMGANSNLVVKYFEKVLGVSRISNPVRPEVKSIQPRIQVEIITPFKIGLVDTREQTAPIKHLEMKDKLRLAVEAELRKTLGVSAPLDVTWSHVQESQEVQAKNLWFMFGSQSSGASLPTQIQLPALFEMAESPQIKRFAWNEIQKVIRMQSEAFQNAQLI